MRSPEEKCPDKLLDPIGWEVWQIEHNAVSIPMGSAIRPSGGILIDGKQVADTLQCCHCGSHWVPIKGSGKIRGWCRYCQGPVCGMGCAACKPAEKMLDDLEKASHA